MVEIDASQLSIREINVRVREAAEQDNEIVLLNPDARHNLCVGLTKADVHVTIRGSAGYFCAGLCDHSTFDIEGNVGWAFGDNLMNGSLRVQGNAGAVCGVAMRSGSILVQGNLGSRTGQVMKGGSIVCRGNAGYRTGSLLMGGTIIILGDAREAVGEFMMDGEIYVAGEITSLGQDAAETDLRDEDIDKVSGILSQHSIEYSGSFRKIVSDQRALRYQEYEKGELLFDESQEQKAQAVAADGNRDVMSFDSD